MFLSLRELKAAYFAGKISRPAFIEQAHSYFHALLFDYAQQIVDSDIASINIMDKRMVVKTCADQIDLIVATSYHRTVPLERLVSKTTRHVNQPLFIA